ncbi:MAG: hypothetical protein NC402_03405 [Prevotella sp.]|nr:hypothetical protein [Prevotella sp.]MCM1074959.1 hypothetical protein [Ruminococcus sp.]
MKKILTSCLVALTSFAVNAQDAEEWKYVGHSSFSSELPQLMYEDGTRTFYVYTEQSTTRPNVYRLKNPFADMPVREGVTRTATDENPTYLVLHIEGEENQGAWFESFDTGLSSTEYGGKIEFFSTISRMILDEGVSYEDITDTNLIGYLKYSSWRFQSTYGEEENERPVLYLRTPNGTINANENDGFRIKLPEKNRIVDIITAETFRGSGVGEVTVGYMDEASGNPGIKSPATYHFKNTYLTAEETGDIAITVNEDGTFTMPWQTNLINTVTGGLLRRVTLVMADDSKGCVTARYSTVPFNNNTSVLVGSTMTKSENIHYPYHGTGTSYVGEEREDYVYFSCGVTEGAKVKRIELEWEFDEGPCKTPTATKSDNPEIYENTELFFGCKTLGSKTYYSVDGGEEIEVQPDEPVLLPWGRHNVKITARRFRKQDSELNVEYKVFSIPEVVTDVIEVAQLPSSPGNHTVVAETSGIEYTIKGRAYPNDNYMSWYDMSAGIMVGKSSGNLTEVRVYHNADKWPNVKQGSMLVGWKEGESMSFTHYSGTKRIATITKEQITADIDAGKPTTLQFATPLDKILITAGGYTAIVPYKVEFDWLAPNQKCEKPVFLGETEFYNNHALMLDCITDGAEYHVTVNGEEVEYNPESGLMLPVGKEVKVTAYTTKEGCPDSDTVEGIFHVVPTAVADIQALIESKEDLMPIEVTAPLTVTYRANGEAYLSDGENAVRLLAENDEALGELQAGHSFTGLKATVVLDAATPEIRLAELPEELTLGDAPEFAVAKPFEVTNAAHYTLMGLRSVSIIDMADSFIATDGEAGVQLRNRYESEITLGAEQGRLFNINGISEAGELIPVRVAKITATPKFSLIEGSVNTDETELTITCSDANAEIRYSVNDGEEKPYIAPFTLPIGTVKVSAYAVAPEMDESERAVSTFNVVSGIEEIQAELGADAEIYTLSGIKADPTNLQPGAYIVKTNNTVKKVIVK